MKIYHSPSYQSLIAQLALDIKNSTQSIFQPEFIVGANSITQNYIKEQLADANGIAANLSFKHWNDFAQLIFHTIKPDTFTSSYISPTQTTSFIFDALDELDKNAFPKVTNYYQNNASKRFGLAQKMYGLFSNYIKFQPSIVMNWEKEVLNFNEEDSNDEKWQLALWKIVRAKIINANLYDEFEIYAQIKSSDLKDLKTKIPTVHVVRTETLSVAQLDILNHLSHGIQVNIHQLATPKNADPNHLATLWKGNQQIIEAHLPQPCFIEMEEMMDDSSTALTQIQNLLKGKNTAFIPDQTLKIDGHYTPYREVEGLFNHLVKRFEQKDENKSRDITVYCNDIKQYIPAIHYFFSNEEAKIPYRIFGEYTYQQNTSLHALEALLKYDLDKLNPEELMGIIQMPNVAQKFGFSDFEAIRHWISIANIRYGYEGDSSIELDLISWKKGLERLILGSLIGDETYNQSHELIDATEGAGYNQLIALEYFVRKLMEFKTIFDQEQNIQQWIDTTHQFIETFLQVEADPYITNFLGFINQLQNQNNEQLAFRTWLTMLKGYFAEIPSVVRPNTNGITFTELNNTQVIPSTVTAVLGLNYKNYPSQDQALSFDLLQHHAEHKANSRKEKDKFNFLQIILQTKEVLLLSYNSFSPKNNKELPPSIVLEQLMDLTNNQLIVTHHPLHGFSTKYNQDNNALFSYTQHHSLSKTVLEGLETLEPVSKEHPKEVVIPMKSFIDFFKDSFKHFYNKKLGIYINEKSNELSNHEILETDALIDWAIRDHFISHPKNYFDLSLEEKLHELRQFKLQGKLPLNQLGVYYADQAMNKYEEVIQAFYEKTKGKTIQEKEVEYKIKWDETTYTIKGKINLFDEELIFPILSTNKNKYKLEWLIKSILLDLDQEKSCLIYKTKDAIEIETFNKKVVNQIISIEDLLIHYLSEELNPFYIPFKLEEIEDFKTLKSNLDNDSYLSEYVAQTIGKPIFEENEARAQRFIQNHNLMYNLINA